MKLLNLYELKKQKEELIKAYGEEHDWEIGYQEYHDFLITNFYTVILGLLNDLSQRKISTTKNINGYYITPNINPITAEFITRFIKNHKLGKVYWKYDKSNNLFLKIIFTKINIDTMLDRFYEELQSVEFTTKTKEEMWLELENFKNNNQESLQEKKLRNKIKENIDSIEMDEIHYSEYFNFLTSLYNHINRQLWIFKYFKLPMTSMKYEFNSPLAMSCAKEFLSFYNIGEFSNSNSILTIRFYTTRNTIKTAYFEEMQRLEYFIGPRKTLKQ